jgi:hypothetical protein
MIKNQLNLSPNIITMIKSVKMRWGGNVAHVVDMRNVYKILVGVPERKRRLGRTRSKWEDNIKIGLVN